MKITILCHADCWGGGEISASTLMKMFLKEGHEVSLMPYRGKTDKFRAPEGIKLRKSFVLNPYLNKGEADILLIYANDIPHKIKAYRKNWETILSGSYQKICVLNHEIGQANQEWFVERIDKFIFLSNRRTVEFLNSIQQEECTTVVLPPPVDLEPFLKVRPNYRGKKKYVRVTAQAFKWDIEETFELFTSLNRRYPESLFIFMDIPRQLRPRLWQNPNFIFLRVGSKPVNEVLSLGNLFHYMTKDNYEDQGPRVIVEAMASGLPVIAKPFGGAPDRITPNTGWLVKDNQEFLKVIQDMEEGELEKKGKAAREHAIKYFGPKQWVKEIAG